MTKKTAAEKYTIFGERGQYWATIFLDDAVGEICVQSEWGNYAYWWGTPGRGKETLKQFLAHAGTDYVGEKFGYGGGNDHFFPDRTVDRIKEDLLKQRRERRIDSDYARICWEELEGIDTSCTTSSEMYSELSNGAPETMKGLYDNSPFEVPWVSGRHPQLVEFMKQVWPIFIAQIRSELKQNCA